MTSEAGNWEELHWIENSLNDRIVNQSGNKSVIRRTNEQYSNDKKAIG